MNVELEIVKHLGRSPSKTAYRPQKITNTAEP